MDNHTATSNFEENILNKFSIIILAAGKGKRMNNPDLPKVMAELDGKPLIERVLETSKSLNPEKICIVVGFHKEKVIDFLTTKGESNLLFAIQEEQLGTGHAAVQTRQFFKDYRGDLLILSGDVPLLSAKTLQRFLQEHNISQSVLSVLSTIAPNPQGYGRIVRSSDGKFIKITEDKDADVQEKQIDEINSGIYICKAKHAFEALEKVNDNNAQKEYYITDIVGILQSKGEKVSAMNLADYNELHGVNSPDDLNFARSIISNPSI